MSYGLDPRDLEFAHVTGIVASVSAIAFLAVVSLKRTRAWRWLGGILGLVTSAALYVVAMTFADQEIRGEYSIVTWLVLALLLAMATLTAWVCCAIAALNYSSPAGKVWLHLGSALLIGMVLFLWANAASVEAIASAVVALPTIGMTQVLCLRLKTRDRDAGNVKGNAAGANS